MISFAQTHSGLVAEAHARKIEPWISRLKSAAKGLRQAVNRDDRSAAVTQLEDVWFWIGRLTAEGLSAAQDPQHHALNMRALRAVTSAQKEVYRARELLSSLASTCPNR